MTRGRSLTSARSHEHNAPVLLEGVEHDGYESIVLYVGLFWLFEVHIAPVQQKNCRVGVSKASPGIDGTEGDTHRRSIFDRDASHPSCASRHQ